MSVRRVGLSRSLRPWGRVVGGDLLTQQLADGPLAAWPMQETSGTTMLDASGNGRHGTYNGGVTLAQSPLIHGAGYSASFNGTTGRGVVADAAWMDVDDWTVEIVAYANSLTSLKSPIARDAEAGSDRAWLMRFNSGDCNSLAWNNSGKLYVINGGDDIATGTPYVLAMTWSSIANRARVWVNGSVLQEVAVTGTGRAVSRAIAVGGDFNPWQGRLSHAAFYDRALSADDIFRHAQVAGLA